MLFDGGDVNAQYDELRRHPSANTAIETVILAPLGARLPSETHRSKIRCAYYGRFPNAIDIALSAELQFCRTSRFLFVARQSLDEASPTILLRSVQWLDLHKEAIGVRIT